MNRIYQGRVSNVEIPDGKDDQGNHKWKPLDNWQNILWQHHELFQDAVNYYLLALLALANDQTSGLGGIKRRVSSEKEEDTEYHIWLHVKKRGQKWQGMRESIRKYLLPNNPNATFSDFCAAVLDGCEADETAQEAALLELLELCNGDRAIQQEGRAMLPRFCSPAYGGDYP